MLHFLILIPKVNSNLSLINVEEELQGMHIGYTAVLWNPFCGNDWQREKNFSMADF